MKFLDFFKRKKKNSSNLDSNSNPNELVINQIHNESKKTNYENLQAISVFLNWAQKGHPVSSLDSYPGYMQYKLNIIDPSQFHIKMISDGYLEKPNLDTLLDCFKVPELKQILSDNNLPKTGNKKSLIDRILNNVPMSSLKEIQNNFNGYVLSEKGKNFIDKNYDFIQMHKNSNWMISLDEYTNKKNQLKFDASFYDIAWGIFNDRNIEFFSEQHWGLVRNNILDMSELLTKENKLKEALKFLLTVLYYDLSGLSNNNILYEFKDIDYAPGIVDRILKLKELYSDDLINNNEFLNQLPFSYFSIDTFKIIINDLINNGGINLNDYKKYIQRPQQKSFKYYKWGD